MAVVISTGSERAYADIGEFLDGAIKLCGLVKCGQPQRQPSAQAGKSTKPKVNSAQRQQNKDVQSALNAFNYPVGIVDGVLGEKSRAAIGNYQNYMGWGPTGYLDDFQRNLLIETWRKLQYGAHVAYPNMMAQEGPKGLLRTALDPDYPKRFDGGQREPAPRDTDTAGDDVVPAPTLPPPPPVNKVTHASADERCDLVELTVLATGGTSADNILDPNQALSEQFCAARDYSIGESDYVLSQTEAQQQTVKFCDTVEAAFASQIRLLETMPPDSILNDVAKTSVEIGLATPEYTDFYGKICLGVGYRTDNAEMALASALMLTAMGQEPFGELVGHHLREGFGVAQNVAASQPWYLNAMAALERGQPPVFEPSSTAERVSVIRRSIEMGGLSAQLAPLNRLVPISDGGRGQ